MITIGIDEVGRGCWAGPLVAGAVVLGESIAGLRDSKKLSKKQRERLAEQVHATALAVGVGWVWPDELDNWGITTAVKRAMERACAQAVAALSEAGKAPGATAGNDASSQVLYDQIIIDGNINYFAGNPRARAVIKADDSEPSVSAASIVAKVSRDDYMAELAAQDGYAGYGFEKHVGYGTAAHIAALQTLGVSDIHRRSYRPIQALLRAAA
jgi:ribonuclease HII